MALRAILFAAFAALSLAGCTTNPGGLPDATPEEVSRAAYVHDGPPALTLYTMVSNRTGAGGHSSLMVNGSQRVIFDPAGSVRHPRLAEKGDVLYGVTPQVAQYYELAHARETYHVVVQRIEVSPAVAEQALSLVTANGRVAQMFCTSAVSGILQQLPGFETIDRTLFPVNLQEQLAEMPGVETRRVYDDDADDKTYAIRSFEPVEE